LDTGDDDEHDEYDFPSPAPSAAAAFIGMGFSRTSPTFSRVFSPSPAVSPPRGFGTASFAWGARDSGTKGRVAASESNPGDGSLSNRKTSRVASRGFWKLSARLGLLTSGAEGFAGVTLNGGVSGDVVRPARTNAEDAGGSDGDDGDDGDDDSSSNSDFDSSFDGFDGFMTPGLPDFTPTKVVSTETPERGWCSEARELDACCGRSRQSPRSAAIRAETENGMAVRIQAAFRGMLGRRESSLLRRLRAESFTVAE
jgi:hypothetical protein